MRAVIEIEEQAKIIANKNYETLEDFDRDIEPYLSAGYKQASIFLRVVMLHGSTRFKNLMFNSKVSKKFIEDNKVQLNFDVAYGKDFYVEKVHEDDSNLFFIDLFRLKDGIRFPFRTKSDFEDYLSLGKKIIFYDIDYNWKEVNYDGKIADYSGWVPAEELNTLLILLALSE